MCTIDQIMSLSYRYIILFFISIVIVERESKMIHIQEIGLQNARKNTLVLSSLHKIGFLMCARECDKQSCCRGFNFKKSILLCELLNITSNEFESREGWIFVNRSWIQDSGYSTGLAGKACQKMGINVKLWSNEVYRRDIYEYMDCGDIATETPEALSSEYFIRHTPGKRAVVLCDMDSDGGGWTVIQERTNGDVDFNRDWNSYSNGFGDRTNRWLGNEKLHTILSNGNYELRIDMEYFNGTKIYAQYSHFYVAGKEDKYKLSIGGYSGDAGDSMPYQNGMNFSTYDMDFDLGLIHCANEYQSGWWYNGCFTSNLNMRYFPLSTTPSDNIGIKWVIQNSDFLRAFKSCSMKIRRKG